MDIRRFIKWLNSATSKFSGGCRFLMVFSMLLTTLSQAESQQHCGNNPEAIRLAKLIINDERQNRKSLKCNSILSNIADNKAREMAKLGRVTHIGRNPANTRLRDEGYSLSEVYPRMFANNVEAIAGGMYEPAEVWLEFKNSELHRSHLLAEHEFYLLQNEIGAGYYYDKNSKHGEYWVVYVAHQKKNEFYTGEIAKSKD